MGGSWQLVLLASLLPVTAALGRPVIISTDPGIDDSIALLLAASSPELDLKAVCIDFGSLHNTSQMAQNALSVLELAKASHVPVYLGASTPLNGHLEDLGGTTFHGVDGLGGVVPPAVPTHGVNHSLTGAEAIVEACREWEQKPLLVSLAPLANIALALEIEPMLPALCPDLYLMGGTVLEPGNVSPLAEANIANDADAASAVLNAGFNVWIAGLDVTMVTWLSDAYLRQFRDLGTPAGKFVWDITRFYTAAYRGVGYSDGGMPLHDPSALLMYLFPERYSFDRWNTTVDMAAYPGVTRGMVIADRRGGPLSPPSRSLTRFAMTVNVSEVLDQLFRRIASLPV